MSHAAILSRRHPLQIPPPQFRGSCQCVGSLFSYKSLSVTARPPHNLSPGCRAVELSRLRRAAVEAAVEGLSRPCLSSLSSSCRVAPWSSCRARRGKSRGTRLTACAGVSRSVEFCRDLCRAVELSSNVELLNSCLAVKPGNAYAYSLCMKHSDSHSSA